MQLLNTLQDRLPDLEQSSHALYDIVSNVQLEANFCVSHPNYQSLDLPAERVSRLQQLPLNLQHKYLSLQLRNFIHSIYFKGDAVPSRTSPNLPSSLLESSAKSSPLIEQRRKLYWHLHANNCGTGYFDPGWLILKQESDGRLAVQKRNLTLHLHRDRHLKLDERDASVGDTIAIRMPSNQVEPDFYVAIGNAGPGKRSPAGGSLQAAYIYFNFNPTGALAVMHSLTRQLNDIGIPFTFKAVSDASDYERYDSAMLHFEHRHYETLRQILQPIYMDNRSQFQAAVPLFTKLLAPGLGLAEDPGNSETTQERFGINRCQIVADSLLRIWQNGENSIEARMRSIHQHFSSLGIGLQHPYLNAGSEDIYIPFN